ncbi:MAG TPA: efflux RND transporter periplasmic adaptor subunit [Vicinamibacterales bacterium]|nr:efflux RND transporter periplasmic adaptor subunit [Vicinamibacterales bacterium]
MASQTTVSYCVTLSLVVSGLAVLSGACRGNAPAQGAAAAPPPSAVQVLTLESTAIEDTSDFIATIRSLRSSRIQPEVEGTLTHIFVKAGQQVSAGTPLVQINRERQAAAVQSAEANVPGAEADVKYWQAQVKRLEALVDAGAISRAEFDQAQNSLRSAEARLAANAAQVKEDRVQLGFTRVEAPHAGIVGDIPVRVGDRVTTSTLITTVDDKEGLEANVQVPLDRSPQLRPGLPLRLLDGEGNTIATNPVTFVAPRVDDATQTVLVKAALREAPPAVRVLQFIRSRIVWREVQGIKAPVTAVTRISGQYFCFVADKGPQGGLVARQRPIDVGPVLGNDYVITSGLKAGDQLIVSGIQKIGDGAPIQVQAQK